MSINIIMLLWICYQRNQPLSTVFRNSEDEHKRKQRTGLTVARCAVHKPKGGWFMGIRQSSAKIIHEVPMEIKHNNCDKFQIVADSEKSGSPSGISALGTRLKRSQQDLRIKQKDRKTLSLSIFINTASSVSEIVFNFYLRSFIHGFFPEFRAVSSRKHISLQLQLQVCKSCIYRFRRK